MSYARKIWHGLPVVCIAVAQAALLFVTAHAHAQTDPLPSWNDGPAKQAILAFFKKVTAKGGAEFVAPGARLVNAA